MKNVVIVGQGYVGLPLAIAAAENGHNVIGFDLDRSLVDSLNSGVSHVEDILDSSIKKLLVTQKYRATFNPSDIEDCDVAIIAVPTPLNATREPDLSFLLSACSILGKYLGMSSLIINESTSYPGTLRNIIAPAVNGDSKNNLKHKFAISPERVDPGNANWKIRNTPRLVSGLSETAISETVDFYSSFCDNLIVVSSPEVAESAKLFENSFRQVNIALVNEFALIMSKLEIPVHEVLDAAGTKPYGSMKFNPGVGVGGHCIPIDPSYLAYSAAQAGIEPKFISLANKVNLEMPLKIAERIAKDNGGNLLGKKILICGVAYKANISDTRESPAKNLKSEIENLGGEVAWHDPLVKMWLGGVPANLDVEKFDIGILTNIHDQMDIVKYKEAVNYFFDCTGKVAGAETL